MTEAGRKAEAKPDHQPSRNLLEQPDDDEDEEYEYEEYEDEVDEIEESKVFNPKTTPTRTQDAESD